MDDDQLLTLIADSLVGTPAPNDVVEGAYAAFGWRNLDTQLARLIEDEQLEVAGFSTVTFARTLTYEIATGTVALSIDGDIVAVDSEAPIDRMALHQPNSVAELRLDDTGRILLTEMSGPVCLEIRSGGVTTRTPWVTV